MRDYCREIDHIVESHRDELLDMSDRIWEFAETGFKEFQSSKLQQDYLDARGFSIETGLSGMETAFCAVFRQGNGGPVLAFLGEFDALPGLSQKENMLEPCPVKEGAPGHGCGHNGLGTG